MRCPSLLRGQPAPSWTPAGLPVVVILRKRWRGGQQRPPSVPPTILPGVVGSQLGASWVAGDTIGAVAGAGVAAMIDSAIIDGLARDLGLAGAHELCELWRTDAPTKVVALDRSLDDGDSAQVARIAHGLKSASALVGASACARLCADIESHARDGRLDEARLRLAALADALRRESEELANYLALSAS